MLKSLLVLLVAHVWVDPDHLWHGTLNLVFLDYLFHQLGVHDLHLGILEYDHGSVAEVDGVKVVQSLGHRIFREGVAVDQGLLVTRLTNCELDEAVVQHAEEAVIFLDTHTSEDHLRGGLVSLTANSYRELLERVVYVLRYLMVLVQVGQVRGSRILKFSLLGKLFCSHPVGFLLSSKLLVKWGLCLFNLDRSSSETGFSILLRLTGVHA